MASQAHGLRNANFPSRSGYARRDGKLRSNGEFQAKFFQ